MVARLCEITTSEAESHSPQSRRRRLRGRRLRMTCAGIGAKNRIDLAGTKPNRFSAARRCAWRVPGSSFAQFAHLDGGAIERLHDELAVSCRQEAHPRLHDYIATVAFLRDPELPIDHVDLHGIAIAEGSN